jgi:GAF domain-containing protein
MSRVPLPYRQLFSSILHCAKLPVDGFDSRDEDDLALAAELARRAALAFDNARLYKRAHEAIALRDEFLSIASHDGVRSPGPSMKGTSAGTT